ncbi:Testis-specific zinc finger protein topi [Gryllus bimaculatus]|nr:Testis-specific zinc finger protein topi [Gryllus bimaculatus]
MEERNALVCQVVVNDQLTDPLAIDPLSDCTTQYLNLDTKNEEEVQNLVSCQKQDQLTDPLAIDPLSDFTTQYLNLDTKNEENVQNLVSCVKQKTEDEIESAFLVKIVPSDVCIEGTSSNFQEEDPLSDILKVPLVPKIQLLDKKEPLDQDSEKGKNLSTSPVIMFSKALPPQKSISAEPQEEDPLADIPGVPRSKIPATNKENMLVNINFPDEPIEPTMPVLVQEEESSLQRSEDGDPKRVLEKESGYEVTPVRNEELRSEHGTLTFQSQNSNVSEEENNAERRKRKSAVAALASIQRSRVESNDSSETETCSDGDYSIDSESSASEEEGHSRSVNRKIHTTPGPSAAATTITTVATTSSASVSATISSQLVSILSSVHACSEKCSCSELEMQCHAAGCHLTHPETHQQAASSQVQHLVRVQANSNQQQGQLISVVTSDVPKKRDMILTKTLAPSLSTVSSLLQVTCACSENHVSSGVEMEYHSLGCPHAHPEVPDQASASHLLQRHDLVRRNSSRQQKGQFPSCLIHSDEFTKQDVAKSPGQIAKSNLCQNGFRKNRIDAHKVSKQINTPKCVKEKLTIESAIGNKAKSLLLHSREQSVTANNFIIRNRNKNYKETLLHSKGNRYEQCHDEVKSTGTEENLHMGEIIIHPMSGLLVSKISYDYSNKNDSVQTDFLYECLKCRQIFSSEQYQQTHSAPNNAEEQSFACHKCEQRMTLHLELAEHYHKKHRSRRQCVCPICGKVLNKKSALEYHVRYVHSSSRPFVCEICSKTFKNDSGLQSHMMVHDTSKYFKCEICNLDLKQKKGYRKHMRSHTGVKLTVKCHKCDKTLYKYSLKRHLQEVHGSERNFVCNVCNKTYVSQARLKLHVRTVHVNKQFAKKHVCEVCGKGKSTVAALRDHMNSHSGEKPYICHVCGKNFFTNNGLISHLILHGDKKFKCDVCGYTCNRMDNLVTHIRSHTGEKPYKCTICKKGFTRLDNLQTHKRLVHNILSSKSK